MVHIITTQTGKKGADYMEKEMEMIPTKPCLNCGKPIPTVKYDTFGRRNTRTSRFCDNKGYCRSVYFRKIMKPDYYKEYYQNNRFRYKKGEV